MSPIRTAPRGWGACGARAHPQGATPQTTPAVAHLHEAQELNLPQELGFVGR